jgi:nitrogen regulatory protein PII-like uncharacterized protein
MWEPADLAKPLFRSAGRNRPKQLRVATENFKTGRLGEAFAVLLKLGFAFTTDIKGILEERFESEEDPEECAKAMKAISEFRALTLTTYRDWKERLIKRFGKEVMKSCKQAVLIDQEVLRLKPGEKKEKHKALVLMRAIENGDPDWRDRLQDWPQECKDAYRIGFQKVCERWLQIRKDVLREGPCHKGTIDILYFEPCHERWRIVKLKGTELYRPEILFEEIKSWLQSDVYDTLQWEIFDEDGPVDINSQRDPRDGERYIVLSQEVTQERRELMNARFKKFLAETRWRRLKSRYKIEISEDDREWGFEPVEA